MRIGFPKVERHSRTLASARLRHDGDVALVTPNTFERDTSPSTTSPDARRWTIAVALYARGWSPTRALSLGAGVKDQRASATSESHRARVRSRGPTRRRADPRRFAGRGRTGVPRPRLAAWCATGAL